MEKESVLFDALECAVAQHPIVVGRSRYGRVGPSIDQETSKTSSATPASMSGFLAGGSANSRLTTSWTVELPARASQGYTARTGTLDESMIQATCNVMALS